MADQWDEAASQFKSAGATPSSGSSEDHPSDSKEDWRVWQRSGDSDNSGPVSNFLSHAGSRLAEIPGALMNAAIHPIDTAHDMYDQAGRLYMEGQQAKRSGDYPLAAARTVESMIPGVGPAVANGFRTIRSGDTSGGIGDMVGSVGPMLAAPEMARGASEFVTAASDPAVRNAVIPNKVVNVGTEFRNAWNRARATATPDTPFSVANDTRPMNGPVAPPVRVLRDANSPAWAAHPSPSIVSTPDIEPIRTPLPSGRVGPAPVSRTNPPPAPSLPPRTPMWQRAGTDVSPAPQNAPVEPIYPSGILPSGRTFGPNLGRDLRSPSPSSTAPEEVRARSTLTPASPPMPVTPAGVARIGTTPAERITALSQSDEGTLGTRAEMMRQLRLADQAGASNSAKQDIIRRFERPEYTPRQFDPRESEIIAPSLTVPESPASTVNPPSSEPPTFANGRIKINVRRK